MKDGEEGEGDKLDVTGPCSHAGTGRAAGTDWLTMMRAGRGAGGNLKGK